jgi:hypothetical protein
LPAFVGLRDEVNLASRRWAGAGVVVTSVALSAATPVRRAVRRTAGVRDMHFTVDEP